MTDRDSTLTKPNEKSVMIWAHRLLRSHGDRADAWALEISEKHRLSNDAYGVAKWQTIAKRICQLRNARTRSRARRGNPPSETAAVL